VKLCWVPRWLRWCRHRVRPKTVALNEGDLRIQTKVDQAVTAADNEVDVLIEQVRRLDRLLTNLERGH
jgi:hypothetical protein